MSEKIFACCYTRFSSESQNESSTTGQLRAIRKYCENNNIVIIDTYIDEAQTGTNMNRESFQRMMNDAPNALWDAVVVYNMSRLSRSVKDTLLIKDEFKKLGKKIISVIENQEETPEGDFFNLITYGMNELFIKQFKRDSWRGLMVNARECKSIGGKPPYGFSLDKDRKYIVNEEEAKVVRKIFKMILDGKSYRQVANYLNEHKYTNRGKPFTTRLTDFLQNEKYKGVYVWNLREGKGKAGKKTNHIYKPDNEVVRIPGGVPQIVDTKTFDEVNRILKERKMKHKYRGPKTKYLLSGILKCSYCGASMSGNKSWSGRNKLLRESYRCINSQSPVKKCINKDINMLYMDKYIIKLIRNVILNLNNADIYKTKLNEYIDYKNEVIDWKLKDIKEQKKQFKNKMTKVVEKLNAVGEDEYIDITHEIGELTAFIKELDKEEITLQKRKSRLPKITKIRVENSLREYLKEFKSRENLKETLNKIIDKIEISNISVKTYVNLKGLLYNFDIDCKEEITICITENRNFIALSGHDEFIDFSGNKLIEAFDELKKDIVNI